MGTLTACAHWGGRTYCHLSARLYYVHQHKFVGNSPCETSRLLLLHTVMLGQLQHIVTWALECTVSIVELGLKLHGTKHILKSHTCKQSEPMEVYGGSATQYGESEKCIRSFSHKSVDKTLDTQATIWRSYREEWIDIRVNTRFGVFRVVTILRYGTVWRDEQTAGREDCIIRRFIIILLGWLALGRWNGQDM
jgi:hypothetical protein